MIDYEDWPWVTQVDKSHNRVAKTSSVILQDRLDTRSILILDLAVTHSSPVSFESQTLEIFSEIDVRKYFGNETKKSDEATDPSNTYPKTVWTNERLFNSVSRFLDQRLRIIME